MTPWNHASEGGKQTQVFVTPPLNSITPNSFEEQNKRKRDNAESNFDPKNANGPIKNLREKRTNSLNKNQFESLTTAKNICYPLDNEDVNGIQQNHLQLAKLSTTEGIGGKVRQTFPHPHHQGRPFYNDIALIELGKSNLQFLLNYYYMYCWLI